MSKANFSPEDQAILNERFTCIMAYNKKIEEHKEEIKELNSSISDTLKDLVERMQADKKSITTAYKEFEYSIKEPELYQEKEDIKDFLFSNKESIK
jgi:hypothetical protein